jgi:hypothetical protein
MAKTTIRKIEIIAKDILTILGCSRPDAWIERGWEAVCLSQR